jgi:predicted GH43/DUF377 family glycosyl hydrolase
MKVFFQIDLIVIFLLLMACKSKHQTETLKTNVPEFAEKMVEFVPYGENPVFTGSGKDTWDKQIRERGYILFEDGIYKMWYTGYNGVDTVIKYLGYATSDDGIHWNRYPKNPIFSEKWTEDMFVCKYKGKYYMYAEGVKDVAHLLTSRDGVNWQENGDLVICKTSGDTIAGPYGTPTIWIENEKWYLFYERNDEAIWLAVSDDHINFTNVQDEPVIEKGPEEYDAGAVAANQVIKYKDNYYIYYHASTNPDWATSSSLWTSNVAVSSDLIHWTKYPGNPIVDGDHSSPILVPDGSGYRLYTMHDKVWLYYGK